MGQTTNDSQAHLREAFRFWLPKWASGRGILDEPVVGDGGQERSAGWLLGKLWNCTDVLPAYECGLVGIPRGSTYARAVRKVKGSLGEG